MITISHPMAVTKMASTPFHRPWPMMVATPAARVMTPRLRTMPSLCITELMALRDLAGRAAMAAHIKRQPTEKNLAR